MSWVAKNLNSKTVYDILDRSSVHPFPARMAPGLVFNVVANHDDPLRILDPMSGSGTVLAVAQTSGHRAVGVDMDPLAVLISRVWTTAIDLASLRNEAAGVLDRARRMFASLQTRDAYPNCSDGETRQFIRFWFDRRARKQLASLAEEISRVSDEKIQSALWCAFSRLIITKRSGASLAMDLSHSRPHKVFKRAPEPLPNFMQAVERVAGGCVDSRLHDGRPVVRVSEGDARSLHLDDGSVDLVLTSPPYLNAIDYLRCSKFSLVWMNHTVGDIRRIRSASIGTEAGKRESDGNAWNIIHKVIPEPRLRSRDGAMLARYVDDMRQVVHETARVLAGGGRAVYVVGENTMRGTFIRNSMILRELASDAGLRYVSSNSRELPANRRYLPPPSTRTTALDKRLRREIVLTLEKV